MNINPLSERNNMTMKRSSLLWTLVFASAVAGSCNNGSLQAETIGNLKDTVIPGKKDTATAVAATSVSVPLDTALFNQKMRWITNGDSSGKWPVKAPYPVAGAIFPFKRVIAYYGNLYSKQM